MPTLSANAPDEPRPPLLGAWASTLIAAMAATWRLWTPLRETPRVVPLEVLAAIPPAVDFVLLAALVWGLLRALGGGWRRGVAIATGALALLMLVDQLRWQPWAWHAVIVGATLASADWRRASSLLRGVTIAVYSFSAVAKLDAEFVRTLGQQIVNVLLGPTGGALAEPSRQAIALALPLGEIGVAALLAASLVSKRLATPALIAAVVMHAVTIAVLSPWGLGHSLGVLLWNAGFAWQTVVLFRPSREAAAPAPHRRQAIAAVTCGVAAILLPTLTVLGCGDQWPGWALYAPGGERATLYVHNAAVKRLPASVSPYVGEGSDSPWRRVRLDGWVLADVGAPIYPQNRIVAAFATWLAERYPVSGRLRLVVESAADRFTAERYSRVLEDTAAIERESRLFGMRPASASARPAKAL